MRLRQLYLSRKIKIGQSWRLLDLRKVHEMINNWYEEESERIKHQAIIKEFQECEKVRIYHHELHKSFIKKSSILKA